MKRTIRQIRVDGNVAYVPLTQGYAATIDVADVPLVAEYSWYIHKDRYTHYARTSIRAPDGRRITLRLHQLLTGFPMTDHIDGDGLNNKRDNLRQASHSENGWNRRANIGNKSGLKGAQWYPPTQQWRARIAANGKQIHLGYYATAEDAHEAYCRASIDMHGSFGRTA
jgi:AP2 domain